MIRQFILFGFLFSFQSFSRDLKLKTPELTGNQILRKAFLIAEAGDDDEFGEDDLDDIEDVGSEGRRRGGG